MSQKLGYTLVIVLVNILGNFIFGREYRTLHNMGSVRLWIA